MDLYPYMGFWIYMVVPIFNFFRIFILFFIMSIKLIYPTIHVCVGHLHVFFGKMSNQFPFPFLNWIVYYFLNQLWFLYISDINPLSDIWFANIFSHCISCLFIFLKFLLLQRIFFPIMMFKGKDCASFNLAFQIPN